MSRVSPKAHDVQVSRAASAKQPKSVTAAASMVSDALAAMKSKGVQVHAKKGDDRFGTQDTVLVLARPQDTGKVHAALVGAGLERRGDAHIGEFPIEVSSAANVPIT